MSLLWNIPSLVHHALYYQSLVSETACGTSSRCAKAKRPFCTNRRKLEAASSSFDVATPIASAATRDRVAACHLNNDDPTSQPAIRSFVRRASSAAGPNDQDLPPLCILNQLRSTLTLFYAHSCGLLRRASAEPFSHIGPSTLAPSGTPLVSTPRLR